jgi:hypothetical protein
MLKVDPLLLYAKDHWGNCCFATKKFKRHRKVPQELFGEVLEGLHRRVPTTFMLRWRVAPSIERRARLST